MLKKIFDSIGNNAYIFMLAGMIVGIAGLLTLMRFDKTGEPKTIALAIGIFGIVVYFLGRMALVFKNKQKKKRDVEE